MRNRIILLTWVSASGKTTLQDELLNRGWSRPINYTTRKPRDENALSSVDEDWDFTSKELEEYIFISEKNFFKKLRNGDFLESTNYMGEHYWVIGGGRTKLPEWDVCIILDPVGRSQVLEYFTNLWIEGVETYYLEINQEEQLKRLAERGDTEKAILRRKRDFKWFSPTNKCTRLNWTKSTEELVSFIENYNG